jgi:CRISPR-associated protein Cas2
MVVMILEAVPVGLRGELTRWLTQLAPTVFVGRISAQVREALWRRSIERVDTGQVIQAWSMQGEPGYSLRIHATGKMQLVDLDGIPAIAVQDAAWEEAVERFRLLSTEENVK